MGVQHAVATFGATVLMPLLMGLDPNLSILTSGVGTLLFFVVYRRTGCRASHRLQRRFCRGGDRHYRL
ncbi:solute carrier family 23 protein [Klebsiella pneumoniae]